MIAAALGVACATLAIGLALALATWRIRTLRGRLAALALIAVGLPLAAVMASGALMFGAGHELTVLAVASGAATAAIAGALVIARSVLEPIRRVRAASHALAGGDLSARAPEDGPRELVGLGADFNRMAAELERLFDARRELVANAGHDLRTPLTGLLAMIEAVEDGLASPGEYIPAMGDEVRRLVRLVDELLLLARLDAEAVPVELRDGRLADVAGDCARALGATAEAAGVQLAADVDDGVMARCAPEHLERVLLNLLANAIGHTPPGGEVVIRAEAGDGAVRLCVDDTGAGIAEEDLVRAFDRFWRADPSRAGGAAGAGLGLAIAKALTEAQGGRIWAERRTGAGTRLVVELPRAGEAPPQRRRATAGVPSPAPQVASRR